MYDGIFSPSQGSSVLKVWSASATANNCEMASEQKGTARKMGVMADGGTEWMEG